MTCSGDRRWGLGLNLDAFDVAYDGDKALLGWGVSSGIAGQALPFGLVAQGPLQVRFQLRLSNVFKDGTSLTGFNGAGTAAVSEPGTLMLLGVGCLSLARRVRRRGSVAS